MCTRELFTETALAISLPPLHPTPLSFDFAQLFTFFYNEPVRYYLQLEDFQGGIVPKSYSNGRYSSIAQ